MKQIIRNIFSLLKSKGVNNTDLKKFFGFIAGVVVFSVILIFTPFFSTIGPVVIMIIFGIFFIIMWFMAGFVVFRSLLVASVGLSLIIFIGQAYCAPDVAHIANDSLKTLIGFGFIYVITQFFMNLYRELFGDKNSDSESKRKGTIIILKEINQGKHSWFILIIFILLISLFVWQIYRVITPIIQGLCIYKG